LVVSVWRYFKHYRKRFTRKKKDLTEVRIAPIGKLPTPDGEWTPDTSWTTPAPATGTLAELIHDLVEGLSAAPSLEQLTQPTVDVTSVDMSDVSSNASLEPAAPEIAIDPSVLEQLDQLLAEPPVLIVDSSESPQRSDWFLGIDIGTTGISAVLLNQARCQLYPLYWQPMDAEGSFAVKKKFRLPTAVTLSTSDSSASPLPTIRLKSATAAKLSLSDWKPYLNVAVPHYSPQTSQWEPVLQWTEHQTVALRTLQEALQQLLITLNPERASFMPELVSGALGLETAEFQAVLQNLAGVMVGRPSNWSDTYNFNVREAILQAGLVSQPDQIVFIEEAIATLLSALPAADGRPLTLAQQQSTSQSQGHLHNANWQGMTLILTAGASLTELVLVNLPQQLHLNHTDFYVRSLPYAGQGIDQDSLTQLLYPALLNLSQTSVESTSAGTAYDFALEAFDLKELRLADVTLPVAELDLVKRHQLQQHLTSSAIGHQLLAAARSLKVTLQHQARFTLKYGQQRLTVERQDFTSQILLPYVQRLNRELNTLLAQTNTTAAAMKQVICTGGTASLGAIARWLRQKLPNATIIQDAYGRLGTDNCTASCSRVAYGLATLPLHLQVLDLARHQYSDYFLLLEMLRCLPQQPMRIETIMQILEGRGIDTQACRFRILALLDGQLPPGLVPAEQDAILLTPESAANPDYQAIRLTPLFNKPAERTYEPNRHQWNYLQQYLATLLADTEQTLSQPLDQSFGEVLSFDTQVAKD
jgi:hypothetical protein